MGRVHRDPTDPKGVAHQPRWHEMARVDRRRPSPPTTLGLELLVAPPRSHRRQGRSSLRSRRRTTASCSCTCPIRARRCPCKRLPRSSWCASRAREARRAAKGWRGEGSEPRRSVPAPLSMAGATSLPSQGHELFAIQKGTAAEGWRENAAESGSWEERDRRS